MCFLLFLNRSYNGPKPLLQVAKREMLSLGKVNIPSIGLKIKYKKSSSNN